MSESSGVMRTASGRRMVRSDSTFEVGSKEYLEKIMVAIVDPEEQADSAVTLVIKDRFLKLRRYKQVFTGANLLRALATTHNYSQEGGKTIAEQMVRKGVIERITSGKETKRGSATSANLHVLGWTEKDFFRLGEDIGVNLKKVVRIVINLKARVKHLEGTLFDTRDSLNEIEADLVYERTTFAHYIHASWMSQLQFAGIVVGFSLLIALRADQDGPTSYVLLCFCAATVLHLCNWRFSHSKFLSKAEADIRPSGSTPMGSQSQSKLREFAGLQPKSNRPSAKTSKENTLVRKRRMTTHVSNSRSDGEILLVPYPGEGNTKETCWSEPPGSNFMVRGETYLVDNKKIPSKETYLEILTCEFAAIDSNVTIETMAGASRSTAEYLAKEARAKGVEPTPLFVVTFLVPGYVLSWYCQKREGAGPDPILDPMWDKFYNEDDDKYRNERLKILPGVSDGIWIVKKTVGKKPAIAARAVNCSWNRGGNYLEVVYDVSTSYVGNKIFSVVKGYAKKITIDLSFLIQGNSRKELPERILCAARFHQMDLDKIPVLQQE